MKNPRMMTIGGAAGVIAVMTLVVGPVSPAAADSSQCTSYVSGQYPSCAGHAWWQQEAEHFFVEDRVTDGHSVALHYTIAGVTKTVYNRNGAAGAVVDVNLDLAEGTVVEYKVCLSNDGADLAGSCSGGTRDFA